MVAPHPAGRASVRKNQPGSNIVAPSTAALPATGPRMPASRNSGPTREDQPSGVTALRPAGVSSQGWRMR